MTNEPTLLQGDCRDVLDWLGDDSVDAVVTDPPYGLSFMGKGWDYDVPSAAIWREVFRVLKPGAHLLSFFGTRTYHRGVAPIEDAGFEIRDQIGWVYGSGFPKSHNLDGPWEGWGTALKPAWEPIILARKPLVGTVAENVLAHRTGALNINGCRVAHLSEADRAAATPQGKVTSNKRAGAAPDVEREGRQEVERPDTSLGRWPANLIHDGSPEVLAAFPETAPAKSAPRGSVQRYDPSDADAKRPKGGNGVRGHDDSGGSAARFFYCAKASKRDRNEGCEGLPLRPSGMVSNTSGQHITRRDGGAPGPTANNHPTVKPTDLMRYLCRLVTPPGGVVLDPFMGSGSTGKAALLEGFQFIGIERDEQYHAIAAARIEWARQQMLPAVEHDFG